MIPDKAEAWISPPWIDKIALVLMEQKSLVKSGNFASYFKQLEVVSEAAVKGAYDEKRKGMNRFLEKVSLLDSATLDPDAYLASFEKAMQAKAARLGRSLPPEPLGGAPAARV